MRKDKLILALSRFGILALLIVTITSSANQKSIDASEYAVIAPLASQSLLLDGIAHNEKLVVVGERGHILISRLGKSWQQVNVPTRSTLTAVYFIDEKTGWVAGHDAVILRTTDGGNKWQRVYYAPEDEIPLLDIWFSDAEHGIAIGAYGLYLISSDGGKTWTQGKLNVIDEPPNDEEIADETRIDDDDDFVDSYDLHLNSITKSGSGKLYIVAEAGRIYRSDDNGETWKELPSPYIGSFFGILSLDNDSLLVFGLRGHLYRSDDAGMTWVEIDTHTKEMLTNGKRMKDGTIYITGLGGTLLISSDGGNNFATMNLGNRNGYTALINNVSNELITIGDNGVEKLGDAVSVK